MRIALVSFECRNQDIAFNLSQTERALKQMSSKADLLCFSEAWLQGFDALVWDYETDREMALSTDSAVFDTLKTWSLQYQTALLFGYIEKDNDSLYSSCAVISEGKLIHNYRRISVGWKEHSITDFHYKEGDSTGTFHFMNHDIMIALCGDLWEYPERFRTDDLLIWPVYVDFTVEEWNSEEMEAYAKQAYICAEKTLMINPLDHNPVNHGGSFFFEKGKVTCRTPFDQEEILMIEV